MKMAGPEKWFVNRGGHSRRVAARAVQRLRQVPVVPGWTYLDVGCGNGAAAVHVADTFELAVAGVDVDAEQIRLARLASEGRRDVVFLHADTTCLPFEDGCFDIVATNKTTHHIPQWRQALNEMARVLKPGGYLIYSDLTVPGWQARPLRSTLGDGAGVFTDDDLDRAFAAVHLQARYQTTRWHAYEAVFVK